MCANILIISLPCLKIVVKCIKKKMNVKLHIHLLGRIGDCVDINRHGVHGPSRAWLFCGPSSLEFSRENLCHAVSAVPNRVLP